MTAVYAAHASVVFVAAELLGMFYDRSEILFAGSCAGDVYHAIIANNRCGVDPVFVARPWRHETVGGKKHRCGNIFKFRLLALPCRSEVARQVMVFVELRIAVCRQHLAVGIYIYPCLFSLLKEL